MGLKCRIVERDGEPVALNADGSVSTLFMSLKEKTGSAKEALRLWSQIFTSDFRLMYPKKSENTVEDIYKFNDTLNGLTQTLSDSEFFQLQELMKLNSEEDLSEFFQKLSKGFKPNGVVQAPNSTILEGSSNEDIQSKNYEKLRESLSLVESLLKNENLFVPKEDPTASISTLENPLMQTGSAVTFEEIHQEILKDFTTVDKLDEVVSNLPYQKFVENYFNDTNFKEFFVDLYQGFVAINILDIDPITNKAIVANRKLIEVRNTLLDNANYISLEADLDYLTNIDVDLWNSHNELVRDILKKTEEKAAKIHLDIIGISELATNRDSILDLLEKAVAMVKVPSASNQNTFATAFQELIPIKESKVRKIDPVYSGLNIVEIKADKSDNELFTENGLIKINENLYHKVDRQASVSDLYEYVYQQAKLGNIKIPFTLNDSKPQALKDLEIYVNSRNTGIVSQHQEEISLFQLAFKHKPVIVQESTKVVKKLSAIKTDVNYLKTKFVSDFYSYYLSERLKNSLIYAKKLSKFQFTDQDISLATPIESLAGISFKQELVDYIKLKKTTEMDYLLPKEVENPFSQEELKAINFPNEVVPLQTKAQFQEEVLIAPKSSPAFVRNGEKVFKKISSSESYSAFLQMETNKDNIYYQAKTVTFSKEKVTKAKEALRQIDPKPRQTNPTSTSQKAQLDSPVIQKAKEPAQIQRLTDFVNASKNVLVSDNEVSVLYSPDSKINSPQKAYAIAGRIFGNLTTHWKQRMGDAFQPTYIVRSGSNIYLNLSIDEANSKIRNNFNRELALLDQHEIEMQEVQKSIENAVQEEIARGVSENTLDDLGYKDIVKADAVGLEVVSLYEPSQEEDLFSKIGDCG